MRADAAMNTKAERSVAVIAPAIEEFLHAYAPVTMAREVVKETVINGGHFKQGEMVMLPVQSVLLHDTCLQHEPSVACCFLRRCRWHTESRQAALRDVGRLRPSSRSRVLMTTRTVSPPLAVPHQRVRHVAPRWAACRSEYDSTSEQYGMAFDHNFDPHRALSGPPASPGSRHGSWLTGVRRAASPVSL